MRFMICSVLVNVNVIAGQTLNSFDKWHFVINMYIIQKDVNTITH